MARRPARQVASKPEVAGVIVGKIDKNAVKKAVSAGADVLELRVDTFKNIALPALVTEVAKLKSFKKPVLITIRSKAEGGTAKLDDAKREEIFKALIPVADMIDIELGSTKILKNVLQFARRYKKKTIVSYHNFTKTPDAAALEKILRKGKQVGADFIKIAARVNTGADVKRLAALLTGGRDNLIIIGMGEKAAFTRVFFPLLGSRLTYGSITGKSAPGQLSINMIKKQLAFYGF